ncbi:Slp family lipoprotein [Pasteurella oralis]|uniref:Slp family lipoprotein n=1 Tax=Pasteurella oralis TaxID=1071947 RepID=A0ABW4NU89_9PAST|nr:Slp family lipoprotein [Pasteurella oralis]
MQKLTALFMSVLLTGCIMAPKGLERDQFTIQQLEAITEQDYACRCKQVRLGGKILSATALKGQMRLEILSLPIISLSAKPHLSAQTNGRFITYLDGFIDPASLKEQFITVKGRLQKQEVGKIDQVDYTYPVVMANHYKLWKLVPEYYYDPDEMADWRESRRRGWGYPFWRPEPRVRYGLY